MDFPVEVHSESRAAPGSASNPSRSPTNSVVLPEIDELVARLVGPIDAKCGTADGVLVVVAARPGPLQIAAARAPHATCRATVAVLLERRTCGRRGENDSQIDAAVVVRARCGERRGRLAVR